MTQDQKMQALELWARSINASDQQINALHNVTGMCDGPLIESIWKLQDALTDAVATNLEDFSGSMEWYRNENSMGQRGHDAGVVGDMRAIESLEDLLWLIEVTN